MPFAVRAFLDTLPLPDNIGAAGVPYESVRLVHAPVEYRYDRPGAQIHSAAASLPCLQASNYGGATCARCQFPTAEAVAAEVAESKRHFEMTVKARAAIVAHIKASGERGGVIDCPNCSNRLGYRQAASNGHIHARCETTGCVAWME